MSDLFLSPRGASRTKPTIAAIYDYTDVAGTLIAQKVRFVPKAFRWRVPDATRAGRFRWSVENVSIGLYNLPALIDAAQVLITEGERAVDRLSALGFAATCPPAGASVWRESWSEDLWSLGCVEAVVLPDADLAGRRHAERVARSSFVNGQRHLAADAAAPRRAFISHGDPESSSADDRALQVKLVALPGIPAGGDVVDFLDAGASASDLRRLIAETPYWSPDLDARRRAERKRQAAAERQRRRRARLKREREALSRSVCQPAKLAS